MIYKDLQKSIKSYQKWKDLIQRKKLVIARGEWGGGMSTAGEGD